MANIATAGGVRVDAKPGLNVICLAVAAEAFEADRAEGAWGCTAVLLDFHSRAIHGCGGPFSFLRGRCLLPSIWPALFPSVWPSTSFGRGLWVWIYPWLKLWQRGMVAILHRSRGQHFNHALHGCRRELWMSSGISTGIDTTPPRIMRRATI